MNRIAFLISFVFGYGFFFCAQNITGRFVLAETFLAIEIASFALSRASHTSINSFSILLLSVFILIMRFVVKKNDSP